MNEASGVAAAARPPAFSPHRASRWSQRRQRRVCLLVTVLGLGLSLFIWVQKKRGFENGCWGLASSPPGAQAGCVAPAIRDFPPIFGLDVATWGTLFFVSVTGVAFVQATAARTTAARAAWLFQCLSAAGLMVCAGLVYFQAAVAKAFCPPCLVCTGVITSLFLLSLARPEVVAEEEASLKELCWAQGVLLAGLAGFGAYMLFGLRVGTETRSGSISPREFDAQLARSLPKLIDMSRLRELTPNAPVTLPAADWADQSAVFPGSAGAESVTVFLDPNCRHCAESYAMVARLAERFGDRVSFRVFSRALWDYSLLQSQALVVAGKHGKYHELWQLQLAQQRNGGLGRIEVLQLLLSLGIRKDTLDQELEDALPVVQRQREKALRAGVTSVPAIFVEGRRIAGINHNEEGLAFLLERGRDASVRSSRP